MSDLAHISSIAMLDPRIRHAGRIHSALAYVSLTGTANTVLLTAPDGATLFLYCLEVYNRNASNVNLQIGTGATLTQTIPLTGPHLTNIRDTIWLPLKEFESTIYVTSSAGAAAPNDVQVAAYAIAVG